MRDAIQAPGPNSVIIPSCLGTFGGQLSNTFSDLTKAEGWPFSSALAEDTDTYPFCMTLLLPSVVTLARCVPHCCALRDISWLHRTNCAAWPIGSCRPILTMPENSRRSI
jgi:hypothetical protein